MPSGPSDVTTTVYSLTGILRSNLHPSRITVYSCLPHLSGTSSWSMLPDLFEAGVTWTDRPVELGFCTWTCRPWKPVPQNNSSPSTSPRCAPWSVCKGPLDASDESLILWFDAVCSDLRREIRRLQRRFRCTNKAEDGAIRIHGIRQMH